MLDLLRQQFELLRQGGWILGGMSLLALLIYSTLIGIAFRLREERRFTLSGKAWRTILAQPDSQDPALGSLALFLRRHCADPTTLRDAFKEVRSEHLAYLERRIPFLFIVISAAPLSGLLGTVVGMLKTFNGLGRSTGISPIEMISTGISQALVTTEAGLLIAIPAYFCTAVVSGRRDRLANSFARLECIASQLLLPRSRPSASSQN